MPLKLLELTSLPEGNFKGGTSDKFQEATMIIG